MKDPKTDVDIYNERYGKDTIEEEFDAVTEAIHGGLSENNRVMSLSQYFTESIDRIKTLDYQDAPVAVNILNNKIHEANQELGLELPDIMVDEEGTLSTEGIMSTLAEITTILFRLSLATFQRTALFISRVSKDVDGLENRLDRLDAIMKRRKTEGSRIFLRSKYMINLVMEHKVTGSPVGDATAFVTSVSSVTSVLNGYVKAVLEKANSIYKSPKTDALDIKDFEALEDEYKERLSDFVDKDNVMLGNRKFEYEDNKLLGKCIKIKTMDRPSPTKVLRGQYFIKSLSNDTIEDYRDSLKSNTLDKLHTMLENTAELYKELSDSKTQGKKNNDAMPETDVKALANYVNTNVTAVVEQIMSLSKLCYEIVDTVVIYMEESAQQEGQDPLNVKKDNDTDN